MIVLVTGPSGIGKTDTCFALLTAIEPSVYLDSDWFSAKSPIDPFSTVRIQELYELLKLNVAYHAAKGVGTFFIALYQEAAMHLHKYESGLLTVSTPIKTVLLTASRAALEARIQSRDRTDDQKHKELARLANEIDQASLLLRRGGFDVTLDTSCLDSHQTAREIVKRCGIRVA